jgi:multidrug efflux pump subunit AcrA (membrane-fusion protein)
MTAQRTKVSAAALGVLLLVLAGCAPGGSATAPAKNGGTASGNSTGPRRFGAIPVLAVTANVGPLNAGNDTAASVVPAMQSTVASQVAGVVLHVTHLAGDWVKEGEPVVVLDTSQLKLAVANAQAALDNARINYQIAQDNSSKDNPKLMLQLQSAQSAVDSAQKNSDSQKALYDIGGAPSSAVDNARSQLQQAQANLQAAQTALEQNKNADVWTLKQSQLAIDQAQVQLQTAQLNLKYASIGAPFYGQIAAVNVNPGMYVSQNTPVYVIVSADKQIDFNVPPADAPTLGVGSVVQFVYQSRSWPVKVSQAPSAPINGVVPMVASAPRGFNAPYGAVGTVSYNLTLAHGAIVPIAALQTNEDQNYVFTIQNGKAAIQYVKIVGQAGTVAAVTGVPDGTQLIMSPPPGLLAGSAVQVTGVATAQGATQAPAGQQAAKPAVDPPAPAKGGSR